MNKIEILNYLKQEKADYEKLGYIPTLELLIEDLEVEINGETPETVDAVVGVGDEKEHGI